MEFRYLLQVVRAHARLLALASSLACVLALAATYVLPEKFDASTTILIRPHKERGGQVSSKAMLDYPVSLNIPVESMSRTYAELMVSEAVVTRVVDRLGLDALQPAPSPHWYVRVPRWLKDHAKLAILRTWELLRYGRLEDKDPYREAVRQVLEGLEAEPIQDTYLFSLTATNTDPELAALIANTAAEVFVEYTLRTRVGDEGASARFVGERLEHVTAELEDVRQRLASFGEGTTAASLDHELALALDALSTFEAAREQTAGRVRGESAEVVTLQQQLGSQSAEIVASATTGRNPVIDELERALARYEVELAGLGTTLQPAHPQVQELKGRIDEARRRLANETQRVSASETSMVNPIRSEVEKRLLERAASRDAEVATLAALDATIERYRNQVASLTAQKTELERIELRADVLESEYRLVSQEQAEARLAAAQELSDLRVLHSAVPPVYPSGPIKVYYAVGGLLMGLLLALAAVLFWDYIDPRVRSSEGLSLQLGTPLLAVVPPAGLAWSAAPRITAGAPARDARDAE